MVPAMPLQNVKLGAEAVLTHPDLVNLYGCSIGDGTKIGPFVEIQKNSRVQARCKISSHTFICEGVPTTPIRIKNRLESFLLISEG